MSNLDSSCYNGNAIFRNQPNHSYFDKSFEDEQDCLFQCLNEIDPHFLKPQQKAESINLNNVVITDPRTSKAITRMCYDYTKEEDTKIFNCPKKSAINKIEHKLGVRVLSLLQQCMEIEEEDMYNWYRLQKVRLKENEYFQKFAFEYSQSNKEQMYAPCRNLLKLYQSWYSSKVVRLKKRYPQISYNAHLGLPHVKECTNALSDHQVEITNQEIISTVGEQCFWEDNTKEELKKFKCSIGSYVDVYANSEDLQESLEDNLQLQFQKAVEQEHSESPNIYIPLESLIYLLLAGDYVDMPTEMILNIKETNDSDNDFRKYIIMDPPLPAKQCGWHSYQQVVEQAAIAMLSVKQTKPVEESFEINSNQNCSIFKIYTLEEFMQKSKFNVDKLCKFSKTLTKWQLATSDEETHFQIYTSLDSCIGNKSVTFKLEYKSQLGCEVLTKYEIIREWLKLKISGSSKISCMRLDISTYQTLVEEVLDTRTLEERLLSTYRTNCNQLLKNLFEFLKLLYNMPVGHYMFRYTPKFAEKLMLCKPSEEITRNTIHLHQLLDSNITDLKFMSHQNFLPIDENVCGLMHLQHNILPATFSPCEKSTNSFEKNHKHVSKQISKAAQPLKEHDKPVLNKTRRKRINRRRRQFAALKSGKGDK